MVMVDVETGMEVMEWSVANVIVELVVALLQWMILLMLLESHSLVVCEVLRATGQLISIASSSLLDSRNPGMNKQDLPVAQIVRCQLRSLVLHRFWAGNNCPV